MQAIRIILSIILLIMIFVSICGLLSSNDFRNSTLFVLTLLMSALALYCLCRLQQKKTVYLSSALIFSFFVMVFGHLTAGSFCGAYTKFYETIYGEPYCYSVQTMSLFLWVGYSLMTCFELGRNPETKITIFWKVYSVAAMTNLLALIGFCLYEYLKR